MITFRILLLFTLSLCSKGIFECYFEYNDKCLPGLSLGSYVLLNETSNEPRQPASDVTATETYNDQGECYFPYQLNVFDMYFCEKNDPDSPATCPSFNSTGPKINCSYGEYGYERFEDGEIGSRLHKLDLSHPLEAGEHCIGFFYYLSDGTSNASIKVILEDNESGSNSTIITASQRLQNRWHEIRGDFFVYNENPSIYFQFEREISMDSLPFYVAIDQITIIDVECAPINTTTIPTTTEITTSTTTQSSTTTSSSSSSSSSTTTTTSSSSSSSSTTTTTSSSSSSSATTTTTSLLSSTTTTTTTMTTTTTTTTSSTTFTSTTITTTRTTTSLTQSPTTFLTYNSTTASATTTSTTISTISSSTSTTSIPTTTITTTSSSIQVQSNFLTIIFFLFCLLKQFIK